jgi:hypothetical protein
MLSFASRRAGASLARGVGMSRPRPFSTLGSESFLNGASAVYVEEMYAAYKQNPARCVRPAAG